MELLFELFDKDFLEVEKCYICSEFFMGFVDVEIFYNGCFLDLVCNVCFLCLDEIF